MKRISYYILLIIITGSPVFSQVLTIPSGTTVQANGPTDEVQINGYTKLLNPNGRVLEITRDNDDAFLTFHDPGDAWYSMGIDRSDGSKFKLNYGGYPFAENHFTLTADGKFGFGTNTPGAKIETGLLPVNDPAFKTMDFQIVPYLSGGGWNSISQPSDIGLIFKSGKSLVIAPHSPSVSGLRITSDGKVGIGSSNPEATLQVTNGLRDYQVNRIISGATEDSQGKNYLLLHSLSLGSPVEERYVMGKISGLRGGVSAWNRKWTVEVNTSSAYLTNRGSILTYNEPASLVTVNYQGTSYLAIEIKGESALYAFSFTGYAYNEDLRIVFDQDITGAAQPFTNYDPFTVQGNVGIGTTNPTQKLTVNGTVYSTEVKVDVSAGTGPDYVFEPTYQLPSLTEIESYIKANKHLPEVPSAKEMETNGINLSEMNMLLLKKVEELTLHLITLEKEVNELKKNNKN
jgi:hypothetical protein